MMDASVCSGVDANMIYWDAHFIMGVAASGTAAADFSVAYRDTLEM